MSETTGIIPALVSRIPILETENGLLVAISVANSQE